MIKKWNHHLALILTMASLVSLMMSRCGVRSFSFVSTTKTTIIPSPRQGRRSNVGVTVGGVGVGVTDQTRLFSSVNRDRQGRQIRKRSDDDDDSWGRPDAKNDDDNNRNEDSWTGGGGGGGGRGRDSTRRIPSPSTVGNDRERQSDDDGWSPDYTPKPRATRQRESRSNTFGSSQGAPRGGQWGREQQQQQQQQRGRGDFGNKSSGSWGRGSSRPERDDETKGRAINMNALEDAGFVHLYGLSSVLNALEANRRDFSADKERASLDEEEEDVPVKREPPKPQAQFRPYLFVQERTSSTRKGQKATDAERVLALAEERGVSVAEVDKGILNTLSGNRPHQGFVLRCGKLYFESMSRVPVPDKGGDAPSLWLVLDEVVDPQNLGALLRSAYFLGGQKIGVMVCAKNSAPPSPVVSASSAGALEVVTVHSTTNLPRTLNQAREDGFRIIGASSSVPSVSSDAGNDAAPPPLYDLPSLPVNANEDDRPVLLVLGSEGYGLRTLVAKACTEFVRIPSGSEGSSDDGGVDSLNVSVTGGILLWQLLNGRRN